jgi:RND family efflux transporter MFP subunit
MTPRVPSALLLLALAGCGKGDASAQAASGGAADGRAATVSVRVARVETARAPRTTRVTGSFEAKDQAVVGAEVAGRIVEVGPEVGDTVEKGALLAKVDATDYELVRDQRARMMQESLTRLGLDRIPDGAVDFDRLPSVERARLEAANAKARHARALRLEGTPGALSPQDVGDLKVAWDVAESAVRAAQLQARTDLAQARTRAADLRLAEQNVRDTEHRVPDAAGAWVVAERRVAVGAYVAVGDPLYRLLDVDPLRLVVHVPERKMTGIEKGRPAAATVGASPEPVAGRVARVRPEVDVRSRTHEVEIEVDNPAGRLAVGAFAVVDVDVGEDPAVPVVPRSSVLSFAGVLKVVVPGKGGTSAERRVTLGRALGANVEIVDGLKAGDEYVVDPPKDIVSGTPIRVEGAPPAAPAAAPRVAPPPADPAKPAPRRP